MVSLEHPAELSQPGLDVEDPLEFSCQQYKRRTGGEDDMLLLEKLAIPHCFSLYELSYSDHWRSLGPC